MSDAAVNYIDTIITECLQSFRQEISKKSFNFNNKKHMNHTAEEYVDNLMTRCVRSLSVCITNSNSVCDTDQNNTPHTSYGSIHQLDVKEYVHDMLSTCLKSYTVDLNDLTGTDYSLESDNAQDISSSQQTPAVHLTTDCENTITDHKDMSFSEKQAVQEFVNGVLRSSLSSVFCTIDEDDTSTGVLVDTAANDDVVHEFVKMLLNDGINQAVCVMAGVRYDGNERESGSIEQNRNDAVDICEIPSGNMESVAAEDVMGRFDDSEPSNFPSWEEYKRMESLYMEATKKIATLEATHSAEICTLRRNVSDLTSDLEKKAYLESKVSDLTSDLEKMAHLESKVTDLTSDLEKMAQLESKVTDLTSELEEKVYELEVIEEQVVSLNAERSASEAQVESYKALSIEKDAINKALIQELVEASAKQNSTVEEYEGKILELRTEFAASQPHLVECGTMTDTDDEAIANKALVVSLRSELETAVRDASYTIDELNSSLTELKEVCNQKDMDLASVRAQMEAQGDKCMVLDMKLKAANYEIERVNKEIALLSTLSEQKSIQINELQRECNELSGKVTDLKSQVDQQKATICDMQSAHSVLFETYTHSTAEGDKLKLNLDKFTELTCDCGKKFTDVLAASSTLPFGESAFDALPDEESNADDPACDGAAGGVYGSGTKPLVRAKSGHGRQAPPEQNNTVRRIHSAPGRVRRKESPTTISTSTEKSVCKTAAPRMIDFAPRVRSTSRLSPKRNEMEKSSTSTTRLPPGRPKDGVCGECRRRYSGEGKKLPSNLKSTDIHKPPVSRDAISSVYSELSEAGFPELKSHLDHQRVERNRYVQKPGQDRSFCSWKCAKSWNYKYTPVNQRHQTHQLICILQGVY